MPFNAESAYMQLHQAAMYFDLQNKMQKYDWADIADLGRRMEAYIIINDVKQEINVWHEKKYCEFLLTEK